MLLKKTFVKIERKRNIYDCLKGKLLKFLKKIYYATEKVEFRKEIPENSSRILCW